MLVLLPPSEGKTRPRRGGAPLDLGGLSFPALTDVRKRVLAELVATCARPDAPELLHVGASLRSEVTANTELWTAPAAPAWKVYSGVLFDALGWSTLDAAAKRRGGRQVLIASALWGWLRPNDRVPAYRLSMDAALPGLAGVAGLAKVLGLAGPSEGTSLARFWRETATAVLIEAAGPARGNLIVDCRSAPYIAAAPIPADLSSRAVAIRVLRDVDGRRTVVSHLAKHTRGEVTRHLLESGAAPRRPADLVTSLGVRFTTELEPPEKPGRTWVLNVVER